MGTGVLRLLGGEVENRYVQRGPTSYSVIGEAMFRPQSASEHAIPTSRQNLLPKLVFIPKPDVSCCACACHLTETSRQKYLKLATGSADTNYIALCRSVKRQGHFDVSWKRQWAFHEFSEIDMSFWKEGDA